MLGEHIRFMYWHVIRGMLYSRLGWNRYMQHLHGISGQATVDGNIVAEKDAVYTNSWSWRDIMFNDSTGDTSESPPYFSNVGNNDGVQYATMYDKFQLRCNTYNTHASSGSISVDITNNTKSVSATVEITASHGWVECGALVNASAGDAISFVSSGTWNVEGTVCGPSGVLNCPAPAMYPAPNQDVGMLIMRHQEHDRLYSHDDSAGNYNPGKIEFYDKDLNVLCTINMGIGTGIADDRFDFPYADVQDQWNGCNPEELSFSCVSPRMHGMITASGKCTGFRIAHNNDPYFMMTMLEFPIENIIVGTVGLVGSGCDIELEDTGLVAGKILKFSSFKLRIAT